MRQAAALLLTLALAACDGGGVASDDPSSAGSGGDGSGGAATRTPHVLLISIDTLRADHLDAYGYERPTAPNLAALAEQGALFEQCVAVSNWTLPTHVSLFTGLHSVVHGVEEHDDVLDPARATLTQAFSAAGYETVGWYSNPFVGARFGLDRGFDRFAMIGKETGSERLVEKAGTPRGELTRSWQPEGGPRDADYFVARSAGPVTDLAIDFLDGRDAERPFFLFLHYNDVHSDYIPPAPYDRLHDDGYAGPLTGERYSLNESVHADMDPEDLAWLVSLYDGEISWVDAEIGRLLAHLEAQGLAEDTVVVVTADHGEGFFEHGGREHHYGLFTEIVDVPWLLRWPTGVAPAQRIPEMASQTDIAPTLLALAGVEGLPEADGLSWAPRLGGGHAPRDRPQLSRAILRPLAAEDGDRVHALRTRQHTVIRRASQSGEVYVEVYDRLADPGETTPLPDDHPAVAAALARLHGVVKQLEGRRDSLEWVGNELLSEEDAELIEQMKQWGYIK